MSSNPKNKKQDKRALMVRIVCVILCLVILIPLLANALAASAKSSSQLKKELDALKNEAQEIINAGLERVIIRNTPTEYTVVQVPDWVYEDDSLPENLKD